MSSCFPEVMIFGLFQSFPLPFPLLKFFLLISYFLSFFHLKFSEMPSFPNIYDALLKPIKKHHSNNFSRG